jgi:hypothetical protein
MRLRWLVVGRIPRKRAEERTAIWCRVEVVVVIRLVGTVGIRFVGTGEVVEVSVVEVLLVITVEHDETASLFVWSDLTARALVDFLSVLAAVGKGFFDDFAFFCLTVD